jgi:hypothetical protein
MLHGTKRYINVPKNELINVCLSSLVNSINNVKDHEVNLIVLDDHSLEEHKKDFNNILSKCNKNYTFLEITNDNGPSNSCKIAYEIIEKNATDLWYHVEDDYLHFDNAIQEMIDAITFFENLTKINVAIFPYDCFCRYRYIYPSHIFHGPKRHYRTIKNTTYTCMASKKIYEKYKFYFNLAANYVCKLSEDETINKVWNQEDVILLSPLPSLAMHIVGEDGKDPYIDVENLWEKTPKLWT